jgi:ribosomal protein S18 acetylase RimI-like enzyme
MTLPDPLLDFWQAWYGLSPDPRPTPWGVVITDHRYPLIYDANHAGVLFDHDRITADDVLGELDPALRRVGAAYRHVEFWGLPDPCPAFDDIAARSDESHTDVDMVFEAEPILDPPADVEMREVDPTERPYWSVYITTRDMFGDEMSAEVIEQMNRRDLEVLIPGGVRMFGAFVDGEMAGLVNLLSLAGVGYLDSVVTLPRFRRRGVATAGVLYVVRQSLEEGDRAVHLLADEGDAPQRLYERLGFRVAARVRSATTKLTPAGS